MFTAKRTLQMMSAGALVAASTFAMGAGTATTAAAASGKAIKIAFLMPETISSPRWESQDRPDFIAAVKKLDPNAQVLYSNAQGSQMTEQQYAESAITDGAQVLVVTPVDGVAAAKIVTEAARAHIPVISYDRLIMKSKLPYYVSFNNEEVGRLQGQYIADHTKAGGTVVMLDGARTDNNALLFAKGAHDVLDPLFKSHKLKLGYEQYTPNWSPASGLTEMEQALTKLNNKVDAVLAANDNLAGAAAQALAAQKIKGLPITGQDATDAGLNRIYYLHTQSMSVYKAINREETAAAELAVDLVTGKKPTGLVNGSTNNGMENVPSVLLQPVVVTKNNVASTVIKDHFTTWSKIRNPGQS